MRASVDMDRLRRDLAQIVGAEQVSVRADDLATYSRDMWPRLLLAVREGKPHEHRPHVVVWPSNVREVSAIVRLARQLQIPVVPYGGGSGVCGGTVPLRGGITVDLKRMDRLIGVSRDEMTCDVEGGLNGERFERALAQRGYTFGHFPSSIYCSTVGGWLATRAAGQLSTKYGKVEDRVTGLTFVTGRGEIIETDGLARAQPGPNWTQLLVGSEGTLGIITSARLRVSPAPALAVYRGFEVESVEHGVEAMRRVLQRGLRPAVLRLYNEVDTFVHNFGGRGGSSDSGGSGDGLADTDAFAPTNEPGEGALPRLQPAADQVDRTDGMLGRMTRMLSGRGRQGLKRSLRQEAMSFALSRPRIFQSLATTVVDSVSRSGCLLIVGTEGARIRTEVESRLIFAELAAAGAKDLGEEPGRHWLEHRYDVSYKMSPAFRDGAFVDTMEVASTWERLMDMYGAVREAISQHALVMAHFSHAYPEGCSIYFSFVGQAESRREAERIYDAVWRDGLAATSRVGGTISHHHGVGLLKSAHMSVEHRAAMRILHALKNTMDPDNLMNPGKLGMPLQGYAQPNKAQHKDRS